MWSLTKMAGFGISEGEDFGYVPQRLGTIRKELLRRTNDKVFEAQNSSEVLGVSKTTYSKFENNKMGTSFRVVFKAIYFFPCSATIPYGSLQRTIFLFPRN